MKSGVLNIITAIGLIVVPMAVIAQKPDEYEEFRRQAEEEFSSFSDDAERNYSDFRQKANEEYLEFLQRPWKSVEMDIPVVPSKRREVTPPPVSGERIPGNFPLPECIVEIPSSPVAPPTNPLSPILPSENSAMGAIGLEFFGTSVKIKSADLRGYSVGATDGRTLADRWKWLNDGRMNNFIISCLRNRDMMQLPDWGYFRLVDVAVGKISKEKSKEHTLLMAYVLTQSGYNIRLATDSRGDLVMLYACRGLMFNSVFYRDEGEKYYPYNVSRPQGLAICPGKLKGSRPMDVMINNVPRLAKSYGDTRFIKVHGSRDEIVGVAPNRNLMDFYSSYPQCGTEGGENIVCLVQANTPASEELRNELYPYLTELIKGKTKREAVGVILNFCQSFPYGRDEEQWGKERSFWPDESWYYPVSDCEDHAIQFVRLVRDLLGLDAALIHFTNPAHLCAGVVMDDADASDDYVESSGKRYIICDPTYFYARVGESMTTGAGNVVSIYRVN